MYPATAATFSSVALIWSAQPLVEAAALSGLPAQLTETASRTGLLAGPSLPQPSPSSLSKPLCYGDRGARGFIPQAGVCQDWGLQTLGPSLLGYPKPESFQMTRADGLIWMRSIMCPLATVVCTSVVLKSLLSAPLPREPEVPFVSMLALTRAHEKQKEHTRLRTRILLIWPWLGQINYIAINHRRNTWIRFWGGGSPPDRGNAGGRLRDSSKKTESPAQKGPSLPLTPFTMLP